MNPKKMQRKTKRTNKAVTMIGVWVPNDLLVQLDKVAEHEELDRSKFIRRAIRNSLAKPA